jgi:hypothetical protein
VAASEEHHLIKLFALLLDDKLQFLLQGVKQRAGCLVCGVAFATFVTAFAGGCDGAHRLMKLLNLSFSTRKKGEDWAKRPMSGG